MVEFYITHCSARKSRKKEKIPALERYLAGYIKNIYGLSQKRKKGFLIFSGKFGFLEPQTKIPYYNKLLQYKDFQKLFNKTDKQYKKHRFKKSIFFHTDPAKDRNIKPYIDFMKEFARRNKVALICRVFKRG
ncbi:MAG: hypothetical protein J7L42_01615 [Elusimicrobia bacterium]|nr:hypothetical protein [Elusimicrobiota bacterium]